MHYVLYFRVIVDLVCIILYMSFNYIALLLFNEETLELTYTTLVNNTYSKHITHAHTRARTHVHVTHMYIHDTHMCTENALSITYSN